MYCSLLGSNCRHRAYTFLTLRALWINRGCLRSKLNLDHTRVHVPTSHCTTLGKLKVFVISWSVYPCVLHWYLSVGGPVVPLDINLADFGFLLPPMIADIQDILRYYVNKASILTTALVLYMREGSHTRCVNIPSIAPRLLKDEV